MAITEKPAVEMDNDIVHKKSGQELDAAQQENAVGYKEYHEALELEVSDKEVRPAAPQNATSTNLGLLF